MILNNQLSDMIDQRQCSDIVCVVPHGGNRDLTVFTRDGKAFRLASRQGHYDMYPVDIRMVPAP